MSIEAMKQALDALEEHGTHYARHEDDYIKAITALRQAIEQAEKIVPSDHTNSHQQELTDRELLQQVLRFLQQVIAYSNEEMARLDALKKLVRDRLEQPEPEPVAWREIMGKWKTHYFDYNEDGRGEPLYTSPREWVGLTQQDVHDAFNFVEFVKQISFDRDRPEWCENFAAYLEAKLKEKNG